MGILVVPNHQDPSGPTGRGVQTGLIFLLHCLKMPTAPSKMAIGILVGLFLVWIEKLLVFFYFLLSTQTDENSATKNDHSVISPPKTQLHCSLHFLSFFSHDYFNVQFFAVIMYDKRLLVW